MRRRGSLVYCKGQKMEKGIKGKGHPCTGRTAHRGSRGKALLFHDHGTGRGEGPASRPGRSEKVTTSAKLALF